MLTCMAMATKIQERRSAGKFCDLTLVTCMCADWDEGSLTQGEAPLLVLTCKCPGIVWGRWDRSRDNSAQRTVKTQHATGYYPACTAAVQKGNLVEIIFDAV